MSVPTASLAPFHKTHPHTMLNLLTTPSLDTLAPMSPPVSPPMHDTATLPAQAATTTTTFAEPAAASTTSTWRPYHSHLARLVMSLPAHGGVPEQPKKTRKMSFSFGGSGETASDEKEFVLEGTVDVFAVRPFPSSSSRAEADLL